MVARIDRLADVGAGSAREQELLVVGQSISLANRTPAWSGTNASPSDANVGFVLTFSNGMSNDRNTFIAIRAGVISDKAKDLSVACRFSVFDRDSRSSSSIRIRSIGLPVGIEHRNRNPKQRGSVDGQLDRERVL